MLAWLVPHETATISAQVPCMPYNHAPNHFMQSHIHKVHACLAVTCHLHVWQNNRDLSHATLVKRGWDGYPNKSQHRKLTLDKKILPIAKLLVCCEFCCYFFYQVLDTSCPAQLSGCPSGRPSCFPSVTKWIIRPLFQTTFALLSIRKNYKQN